MKNILITGASSGIGKALAIEYAKRGYQVFAGGRNESRLLTLQSIDKNIQVFTADLTQSDALLDLNFQGQAITLPKLDVLILNAGNCEYIDDAQQFDGRRFARVINDNLTSVGYCLEAWLPLIKPQGQLAITSSSAAFLPLPRAQAYGASKAALTYLAKTLSIDLKSKHIDVSVIHPGFVDTPLTKKNDFAMPCTVTTEQACAYILRGLDNRAFEINFPKKFIFTLRLLAWLPFRLWRGIASKYLVKSE